MSNKYFQTRSTPAGTTQTTTAITLSTELLLDEATAHGVDWKIIPDGPFLQLSFQGHQEVFYHQIPAQTSQVAYQICLLKPITKQFFVDAGISTPHGFTISKDDTTEFRQSIFTSLKKPLVVKPLDGSQGKNVFVKITDANDFEEKVNIVITDDHSETPSALVEEMAEGTEYRILATRTKVLGIINRIPANVIGDGTSTIQQLIDQKNADPRRSDDPRDSLIKIKVDSVVQEFLDFQKLTLDFVPAKDQRIFLRQNSNISTGGDSIDATDTAHPSVHEIALRAIQAIPGLAFAGIDFVSKNIEQPQGPQDYSVLEINASPGYSIHDQPFLGKDRQSAKNFLYLMFPELASTSSGA